MKQYQFEFNKFVKDLERRAEKYRAKIVEQTNDMDEQQLKREIAKRYHEHPHNAVVYDKDKEK